MSDSLAFDLIAFRPATAARVTGVSVQSQRDWRRRGLIARQAGGTGQLHVGDLTLLALFATFAELLGGPSAAATAARAFAGPVVWRVLAYPRAWADDYADAARASNVCAALGFSAPPPGRFGAVAGDLVLINDDPAALIRALGETVGGGPAVTLDLDRFASGLLDEIGDPVAATVEIGGRPHFPVQSQPARKETLQ